MKKQQNQSQYRQLRQSTDLSADVLEELKMLKSLEARETQKQQQT